MSASSGNERLAGTGFIRIRARRSISHNFESRFLGEEIYTIYKHVLGRGGEIILFFSLSLYKWTCVYMRKSVDNKKSFII